MKIAALIYFLILTTTVFVRYPQLLGDLRGPVRGKLTTGNHAVYHSQDPTPSFTKSQSTFIYREDIERTGVNHRFKLPSKLRLAWAIQPLNVGIHTASKSSPAVDETGVYVGADSSWFYAFNHQGKLLWSFYVSGASKGIHSTAALDGQRVYFGAYNGTLYSLDKKTGSLVWAVQLGNSLGASAVLDHGFLYAAVELSNPIGGFVAKIDAGNGKVIWISPRMGDQTHSSPTINEKAQLVYAGANDGVLYAFDLNSGKLRWSFKVGGPIKTTSLLVDDTLFVSSWAKSLLALNARDGKFLWQAQLDDRSRSSPTPVPGLHRIIVGDEAGGIYGVDDRTGKIDWKKTGKFPLISSALVLKNEKEKWLAWLPCHARTLCALDPINGHSLFEFSLANELTSVPTIWSDGLYLSLNKTGGLIKLESIR
jgi:outer membrane protein assembly factor BamB